MIIKRKIPIGRKAILSNDKQTIYAAILSEDPGRRVAQSIIVPFK
jgi:hypothetical protein